LYVQHFTQLQILNCSVTNIEELDLSPCTQLKRLKLKAQNTQLIIMVNNRENKYPRPHWNIQYTDDYPTIQGKRVVSWLNVDVYTIHVFVLNHKIELFYPKNNSQNTEIELKWIEWFVYVY
jgi:hypothetical protein